MRDQPTQIDVTFLPGCQVETRVGDFTLLSDQPLCAGGTGAHPTPFEYFLASIAACSACFARAYCEERDISTAGMGLRATYRPRARGGAAIELEVALPEGFPEAKLPALARAIDKCAVKKHLVKAPVFSLVFKKQPPSQA